MATFNWPRLVPDMKLTVAETFIPQIDVIFLAAPCPVPKSDLGVWDFIHEYKAPDVSTLLTPHLLQSIYKARLVHIRHNEHGSNSLRRRQDHLKWIIYLRLDIRSFAEVVCMLNGSSLCHYPVDTFKRLQVLALDTWPSITLHPFLAERTITRKSTTGNPGARRPKVKILVTVNDLRHQMEPDETLALELNRAFDAARQSYSSTAVRTPPKLREIRIKIDMTPQEFNALQGQIFDEPDVGRWSFQTNSLAGPGEFMLLWTEHSDVVSVSDQAETSFGSSLNLDEEPLCVDEYLNMEDLRS